MALVEPSRWSILGVHPQGNPERAIAAGMLDCRSQKPIGRAAPACVWMNIDGVKPTCVGETGVWQAVDNELADETIGFEYAPAVAPQEHRGDDAVLARCVIVRGFNERQRRFVQTVAM